MAEDRYPQVLRPHERRAQAHAELTSSEDDPFGTITPPTADTIEALEAAFPVTLPPPTGAEHTLAQVERMRGQQDVIRFLKNLTPSQQGAE